MILEALEKLDAKTVLSYGLDSVGIVLALIISIRIGYRVASAVRDIRWRKNPKVGDNCWFHNMGGDTTVVKVEQVSEDKTRVLASWSTGSSSGHNWHDLKYLHFMSKFDMDMHRDAQLKATLKRLRKL